jgi:hypothetical protein
VLRRACRLGVEARPALLVFVYYIRRILKADLPAMADICAVIITHATAPVTPWVPVPFIVTTDNPRVADRGLWGATYVDVGDFAGTELAIGAHIHGAINAAFTLFPKCTAVSVIEDDISVSDDYFTAVQTAMTAGADCFTCINDRGAIPRGWDPAMLRPVTHSIGIGMAIQRRRWTGLLWGVGLWDNFLRATSDMVCLTPEISRCRHKMRRDSMHGLSGPAKLLNKLPVAQGQTSFAIRAPPTVNASAPCHKIAVERHRGTYRGIDELGCQQVTPLVDSGLVYLWVLGAQFESCDDACTGRGLHCSPRGMREPAAVYMEAYNLVSNQCTHYGAAIGRELPSMVSVLSNVVCNVPVLGNSASCSARHRLTRRLCPCFRATKHNVLAYMG